MRVAVVNAQRGRRVSATALRSFALRLAKAAPKTEATDLTLVLAGDAAMRRLNRSYRGKDATTDVLSFPGGGLRLPDGSLPLGDLVVSVPVASRQAREAGHPLGRELRILLIHGYLHLLGYDHEVDGGAMVRVQRRLVERLLG